VAISLKCLDDLIVVGKDLSGNALHFEDPVHGINLKQKMLKCNHVLVKSQEIQKPSQLVLFVGSCVVTKTRWFWCPNPVPEQLSKSIAFGAHQDLEGPSGIGAVVVNVSNSSVLTEGHTRRKLVATLVLAPL